MATQEPVNEDSHQSKRPRFADVAKHVIDIIRFEKDSEAHMILRDYIGNEVVNKKEGSVPGVVHPGATGVIYATDR
jgi:hypothetical protein